ncbi:hypothetical protein T492DRAFT_1017451 [Pavlovales sp. CCMP2436]|nr:hypothetical protein T492DRAFT_1017451 [Pavlovales sp. CCMP2436]
MRLFRRPGAQGHSGGPPHDGWGRRRVSGPYAVMSPGGRHGRTYGSTSWAAATRPRQQAHGALHSARTAASGRSARRAWLRTQGPLGRALSRCTSARTAERAAARVRRARLRVQGYDYKASRASSLATHRRRVCGEGGVARVVRLRTASPAASTGLLGRVTPLRTRARTERRHAVARDDPGCEYKASRASSLPTHWCTHSAGQLHARGEPGCEHRATRAGHFTAHKRTHSGDRSNEIGCDG